jgi:hypothetical protein
MGGFALATLGIRLLLWALVLTVRFSLRTAVFAWRRPRTFIASLLLLPVLFALPEYIS